MKTTDKVVLRQIHSDLDALNTGHAPGSVPELRWLVGRLREPECRAAVRDAIEAVAAAGSAAAAIVSDFAA